MFFFNFNIVAERVQAFIFSFGAYALAAPEVAAAAPDGAVWAPTIEPPGNTVPPDLPLMDTVDVSAACADFTGSWRRPSDGITITLTQSGCEVRGGFAGHSYTMVARGDTALGTVQRTYMGCTTIVAAQLTKVSSTQIREDWAGTDGRCDLGPDYRQADYYDKV